MGKRTFSVLGWVTIFMLLVFATYAQAKVTGSTCSDCHTMHNSQNGTIMRLGKSGVQPGPSAECYDCHGDVRTVLLRLDCLGCHADNVAGASNIINTNWPQVAHNDASGDLAGGNYRHIIVNDDRYGHNVHGFGSAIPPGDLGNNPPGYDSDYDPVTTGQYNPGSTSGQIMCAGRDGCHGNRDNLSPYLAMKGTHHADDSMLKFGSLDESNQGGATITDTTDYTTAGKSYRFLYNVHGGEDSDWEATVTPLDHNQYKGEAFAGRPLGVRAWGAVDTISEFCSECHGYFHASDEITNQTPPSGSPWTRHPTDAILPNSGEYSAYTAYSTEAPVARPNIADPISNVVTPGTDIVMCLSCHRAHASAYPDILRWDYSTMIAGGGGSGGCFTCHTQKNTSP